MSQPRSLVFLVVSHGWTVRNYLLGSFLPALASSHDVVVCSPLAGEPEFDALCAPHVVRTVPLPSASRGWLHRRLAVRRTLYHFAWAKTESMQVKRERSVTWHSSFSNLRNHADYAIADRLAGPTTLRALDWLERREWQRARGAGEYEGLFGDLRPALVLSTASVVAAESLPLHVAQRVGVPTATCVMSWDNLTSKGRLPSGCDWYLVWSERMKEEALRFHPDLREDQVLVVGTPQFDAHQDRSLRVSRAEFCRWFDLDPARPLIVYGGVTPGLMPNEPRVVSAIAEAMRAGRLVGHPQLLVRLHPVDPGTRYAEFTKRWPDVRLSVPGAGAGGDERRLVGSSRDLGLLVNTLAHGDVHLNVASTATIDAAVLDRPVVNVAFDLRTSPEPVSPGVLVYRCTHYQPVLASGGVRVAGDLDELIREANEYLRDPRRDAAGRRAIVEAVCGPHVGSGGAHQAAVVGRLAGVAHAGRPVTRDGPANAVSAHLSRPWSVRWR